MLTLPSSNFNRYVHQYRHIRTFGLYTYDNCLNVHGYCKYIHNNANINDNPSPQDHP